MQRPETKSHKPDAMQRLVIQLPRPVENPQNCLPHAAMNLGAPARVGIHPRPGMVSQLVIQEQFGAWVFYRMDEDGGYVGDSWHPSREDALHQAQHEFGIDPAAYR